MDAPATRSIQLDFKTLVDQSINLLDGLSKTSRCDALHYLLQSLRHKFREDCDQVVRKVFAGVIPLSARKTAAVSLLTTSIKEEIKTEGDGDPSTDLNQNFEKILCKEEFVCLDEDDVYADDDGDTEMTHSTLRKKPRLSATTTTATVSHTGPSNCDPLDLIPSSLIDARRLGRVHFDGADNSLELLPQTELLKRNDGKEELLDGSDDLSIHITNKSSSHLLPFYPHELVEKILPPRTSRLGESYVFYPDSDFTVRFHHSSAALSARVSKEQFRIQLKIALSSHHKPFLMKFYDEFILTGRLLGTTPSKHVLLAIRAEREQEWNQQIMRKQLTFRQEQQNFLKQYQQKYKRHCMLESGGTNAFESDEADEVLDGEVGADSVEAKEIIKFEEIIDEGVEPGGRIIDGLVMESEIEDVLSGSGNGTEGTSSIGARGNSDSSIDNGLDNKPIDLGVPDSDVSSLNIIRNEASVSPANHFGSDLSYSQHQLGSANLVINGLSTANNLCGQEEQVEDTIMADRFSGFDIEEQQKKQQHQLQFVHSEENAEQHDDAATAFRAHNKVDIIANSAVPALQLNVKPATQHNINNIINNNSVQQRQQHFQAEQHQHYQQRYMMQQQPHHHQPLQQNNHFNARMPAVRAHPLAMIGGMMESANQEHQQLQMVHQRLQQQQQQNADNSGMVANSIENILDGATTNKANPPAVQAPAPALGSKQMQFIHYQQQQQQHLLQQQQQQQLPSHSNMMASQLGIGGALPAHSTKSLAAVMQPQENSNAQMSAKDANTSFDHDDNDMSQDEEDEDHETNDTNDGMEVKPQLIDGGSSSSTSLQAPSSASNPSVSVGGTIQSSSKKEKPSYSCLLCPKSYRKRKSLLDHYKIHPGHCHDCGQPNGTTLEEIIHHNRTVHAKEYPFVCETCGESYSRRQQFHAHVESHNKKEFKTYSCHECGQKFSHKKLHQQHLDDTGHKVDGAICEVCGDEFPSKNALYQHIIRVHKKDNFFECHICQNRFTLKANLERHVQLHTEIKRTYVCDLCGSSYFTYPALKDHYSNAHTDASECKCTLCGKRFGSVKSLQRHLPSHSEERPHCCCYCDQTFKWKTHLVRHKQTVHGNQPSPKKVKRFTKEGDEIVSMTDVPGPPPAKVAKKSNTNKSKQQQNQQQQPVLPQQLGSVSTPPPLSTTPGTSSSSQQEQFNAGVTSNNSSQSSTASTSQHSLTTNEQQPNSMYSQNFSAEKLLAGQPQQQQQQQQQQQVHVAHGAPHAQAQTQGQQQQRPTPPPTQQHHHQTQAQQQQQQHHRHTPNSSHTPDNIMPRLNTFAAGLPGQAADTTFHHFDQSAAGVSTPILSTNPAAYQQHQIINQYHQQQQLHATAHQQQQQLRSHTPQTPQSPHHQQAAPPPQMAAQHFTSPHHHLQAAQHHQQMHHHQQMLQQQQHQLQQQHQRHNQQRSPHHHHQTQAQQLQQQHQQQASHSPQHVAARLQSPQPQSHTPQPSVTHPQNQQQPQSPALNHHHQQQQQQQQQYQQQQQQQQQHCVTDPWGNINFLTSHQQQQAQQQAQQQQQQQQHQSGNNNVTSDVKDSANKFYIVDSAEFLGLPPINVGANVNAATPGTSANQGNSGHQQAQQQQQQQQRQSQVEGIVSNASKNAQSPEQALGSGGDLISFQSMWPQTNTANQLAFAGGSQQSAQQQQPQQPQQQSNSQQQQQQQQHVQQTQSNGQTPTPSTATAAADAHNYNNIGSILTNLIDNNQTPMEYNFELMQQNANVTGPGGVVPTAIGPPPVVSLQPAQQQSQQQQQQQQHHPLANSPYGLQGGPSAVGMIRHSAAAGAYGATASLYDTHHPAHHVATGLGEISEQQKNSFQPYHPHAALQPHAHAHAHTLAAHPLAPTAHHPLSAASHLLPHAGHHVYERGSYPVLSGEEPKTVLPPISDYMHHMQQQQHHVQQPDLLYYPGVKND